MTTSIMHHFTIYAAQNGEFCVSNIKTLVQAFHLEVVKFFKEIIKCVKVKFGRVLL